MGTKRQQPGSRACLHHTETPRTRVFVRKRGKHTKQNRQKSYQVPYQYDNYAATAHFLRSTPVPGGYSAPQQPLHLGTAVWTATMAVLSPWPSGKEHHRVSDRRPKYEACGCSCPCYLQEKRESMYLRKNSDATTRKQYQCTCVSGDLCIGRARSARPQLPQCPDRCPALVTVSG